jgi:glycosyltransferase involved in cell wall biosynthesis
MAKISYCITVYNEFEEIQRLINILLEHKQPQDEICVLFDGKGPQEVLDYLESLGDKLSVLDIGEFNNNFADWKNRICEQATGDSIFNLDADEYPDVELLLDLHDILLENPLTDAYWVPRVNLLSGDRDEIKSYCASQGWILDEHGRINWKRDHQLRIFRNSKEIRWEGKVHERITGFKVQAKLPDEYWCSIYHPKTLDRQKIQNKLYSKL